MAACKYSAHLFEECDILLILSTQNGLPYSEVFPPLWASHTHKKNFLSLLLLGTRAREISPMIHSCGKGSLPYMKTFCFCECPCRSNANRTLRSLQSCDNYIHTIYYLTSNLLCCVVLDQR
jgi:hypothetical protein